MKKRLFLVISAIMIAAIMGFAVACGDTEEDKPDDGEKTYTITYSCNHDYGTVEIEDANGNAKTEFEAGESVTVTVTPDIGYVVSAFKVDGETKSLTDNKYTFTAEKETAILVEFDVDTYVAPEMTQAILDASKSNLEITGTCVYSVTGEKPITYDKTTIFGTDSVYYEELLNGEASLVEAWKNVGGKAAAVTHTIDNDIKETVSESDFSEYANPFGSLAPADFTATNKADVFEIKNAQKARDAATAITGWNENIGVFEVTVKDGKLASVHIETDNMVTQIDRVPYKSVYELEFSKYGTAELAPGIITPYAHEDYHDTLSAALSEMANATSYTVSYLDHEDGYADIVYDIYVTPDIIYEDCVGWETGYVKLNGKVYPFSYRPNEDPAVTLQDPVNNIEEVSDLKAGFVGNYAKELFELTEVGDGYTVYTLRCNDFAGDVFAEFGDGVDKMKYYSYAYSGSIMLDENNKLFGATFNCYYYYNYSTVTLTYNNVNNTEAPDELDFSAYDRVSKLTPYVGTYVDKYYGTGMKVVIDEEDGFTIDGTVVDVVGSASVLGQYLVISYEDEYLYVEKKSARLLSIYSDAYYDGEVGATYYEFVLESDDPVEIPNEFVGGWMGYGIGVQTLLTGKAADDVVYDEATNTIAIKLYTEYGDPAGEYLIVGSDDEVLESVIFRYGDGENEYYEFVRDIGASNAFAGEMIPTKYTGRYVLVEEIDDGITIESILYIANDVVILDSAYADDAYVNIAATTITLNEYDEEGQLQSIEIEVLSYDETDGLVGYYNGLTLYFELDGDTLNIKIADGYFYTEMSYVLEKY